jgi:hypothetical protein
MHIREDTSFHGMIDGDVTVAPGVTLLAHGKIAGDLDIAEGATVELRGMVAGSSLNRGNLKVYGVVRGFMRDEEGGRSTPTSLETSAGARDRGVVGVISLLRICSSRSPPRSPDPITACAVRDVAWLGRSSCAACDGLEDLEERGRWVHLPRISRARRCRMR